MLSLVVYAIGTHALGISSGVRYVPQNPFLRRCLPISRLDGHEHISLMPFFIVLTACWRLGARVGVVPDTN